MLGGEMAEVEVLQAAARRAEHEIHVVVADGKALRVEAAKLDEQLAPHRRQGQGVARNRVDISAIGRIGIFPQRRPERVVRGRRMDVAVGAEPSLGVLQTAAHCGDRWLQGPGAKLLDQGRVL